MSEQFPTRRYLWIALLILIGQVLLLTYRLADQSMWSDEMYTARIVLSPTVEEALDQTRLTETRPPLHYLTLWAWARLAGPSEFSMRFVSIAASLLTTAIIFRLAGDLTSPRTAVWVMLLSATAPSLLWHGRIIRGYAAAAPLALLSTLAFWRARRTLDVRPKLIYLLSTAAFLFTDYLTVPVLGAHVLYLGGEGVLALRRRSAGALDDPAADRSTRQRASMQWLVVGIGLLIALGGLVLYLRTQVGSGNVKGNYSNFNLVSMLSQLPSQIPNSAAGMSFLVYAYSVGEAILPWNPLALPGVLAAVILAWLGLRKMWRERNRPAVFAMLMLAVPAIFNTVIVFGLLLGASALVAAAARSMYLAPLLFIPIGLALDGARTRPVYIALFAALIAARGVCVLNQTSGLDFLNPVHGVPTRELAVQVARNIQPGDVVVFEEPLAFDYYFRLIDPDTPLFTVGGDHIGHTLAIDATPDSPEFLGRRASFISAISAERLLAYLRQSLPPRLWLVVFQHEAGDQTVGTDIAQPLVQTGYYEVVSRVGYAPQDPIYSQIRARLRGRTSITYKAEIVLYIRTRDQDQTPAHTLGKD